MRAGMCNRFLSPAQDALPPVPLLDSSDALVVVVAPPPRAPPASSVAVSGVMSGPPPVQRGPVLFHVGRCCCRWSWCVRLSAPPCAPLFGPRVSAVRRPFPPREFSLALLRGQLQRAVARDQRHVRGQTRHDLIPTHRDLSSYVWCVARPLRCRAHACGELL
jgi:hypothetical protein